MKRFINVFVAIALILGFSLPVATATNAETPKADVTFTILHTNDFHGNLELCRIKPGSRPGCTEDSGCAHSSWSG